MIVPTNTDGLYISFYGPFNLQLISFIGKYLNDNLNVDEQIKMKLYKVLIELAQNVALYSAEKSQMPGNSIVGMGTLQIRNTGSEIQCTTINKISKEHAPILLKNCNEIIILFH